MLHSLSLARQEGGNGRHQSDRSRAHPIRVTIAEGPLILGPRDGESSSMYFQDPGRSSGRDFIYGTIDCDTESNGVA